MTLGGRTVAEWQQVMSYAEFCDWVQFYMLHPFDDTHRYHRPAALISQSMAGGKVEDKLKWLKGALDSKYTDADMKTLEAFGIKIA